MNECEKREEIDPCMGMRNGEHEEIDTHLMRSGKEPGPRFNIPERRLRNGR